MLIEFNEENWPIPQRNSLVGEGLIFLLLLWNGELFLLEALGGAAKAKTAKTAKTALHERDTSMPSLICNASEKEGKMRPN